MRAGDEASAVGGPDEAAAHYQQALELLADPRRTLDPGTEVSKIVVAAADALTASGHPLRAAAITAEQLDRYPADVDPVGRARILAARALALGVMDGDDDAVATIEEAVALLPEGAAGLRARVLAVRARIMSSFGRFDEAQAAGLEALALAERLGISEIVSDAITTLSGLKKAGPKEGLREALRDAIAEAERSGAIHAELRGRFLLGRSYEDWAEFEETEKWFRSAIKRGTDAGIPWAPYSSESRWQLGWVFLVQGRWDEGLALLDLTGQTPPPVPEAMLDSIRLTILQWRGVDVAKDAARMRRLWRQDGAVPIHAAALEIVAASRRDDVRAALAAYDDVVAVLGEIWHEWFSARIRLAALALAAIARAMPRLSAADRPDYVARAARLHEEGRLVLERYSDPSGHWGPEGRAWVKRLDAEALRVRWLGGVDVPPAADLIEAWREAEQFFLDFGYTAETAQVRTILAGILRATGDPAGAREVGDLARKAARALGAQPLLDELRSLGNTPSTRAAADPEALTAREREILALVAEGRSNGEIGKQLFISAKTVSVHVSNILGKLGAAGRTEAAAIARRRGLLGGVLE